MNQYSMIIQWSDEDQVYIVTFPEFPFAQTHGETHEAAARQGEEVLGLLVEDYQKRGQPLPLPVAIGEE